MCNLYSVTTNQEAIRRLFGVERDLVGNLPPLPGIFPDYPAPIVRRAEVDGTRELALARWGMPSSSQAVFEATKRRADRMRAKGREIGKAEFDELLRKEPDGGTTNVRNTASRHWRPWLEPAHRCLVPVTSFSEFNREEGGDVWFALDESRPLACFAGIWLPRWTGVRKLRTGVETVDLFAFLTTEPSEPVRSIHPKAMPALLTTPEEWTTWLEAEWSEASSLQRPLPDGVLEIVARGGKEDPPPATSAPDAPDLFSAAARSVKSG